MPCEILYLEKSYKARFSELHKCVGNDSILNMIEYTRNVTEVQSLLLDYQPNYNSNRKSQYQGVSNQLMFTHHGKTGDDEVETK